MNELINKIFDLYVISMMNQPYLWGGDDPINGFDCSGLVIEWFKTCGIFTTHLDMSAQGIYNWLKNDPNRTQVTTTLEKGGLVFFGESNLKITHVALLVSSKFMFEAGGGNLLTMSKEQSAKQNAYVRIRPVGIRRDFIGYLMPKY